MRKFSKAFVAFAMVATMLCGTMLTGYAADLETADLEDAMDIEPIAAVSFSGVSIDATNTGVELVRTSGSNVTIEYLGVDNQNTYTVTNTVKNGVAEITIKNSNSSPSVNFEPSYKNVVRVNIPNASYNKFNITLNQAPISMQDFTAPIVIGATRSTVTVSDNTLSRGTYNITGSQGNVNVTANTITKDITIKNLGTVTLTFNQKPTNLYLSISSTTTTVPSGWSTNTTTIGNGTPKITINNTGQTLIYGQLNVKDC